MSQKSNFNTSEESSQNIQVTTEASAPEKITLWGEIVKGWYWAVFIVKMMGSFGGIRQVLSSIKRTVIMLIKRLLIQMQSDKRS